MRDWISYSLFALLILCGSLSCSDDADSAAWDVREDGVVQEDVNVEADVADDADLDAGRTGPEFVGEAYFLATALERIAVIARDQNSPLCVAIILVSPSGPGTYSEVRTDDEWGVESITARPQGCPERTWSARDGLRAETATGQIGLLQEMAQDRFTSVAVDVVLGFAENDRDVPVQIELAFPRLSL